MTAPAMITDLLAAHAAATPDRPFAVTEDGVHGYAAIHEAALRTAGRLAGEGIRSGDHVALAAGNSAAYLVAWFGIMAVGAVAVTINPALVGDGLAYVLRQSDARLLIADDAFLDGPFAGLGVSTPDMPLLRIRSEGAFLAEAAGWPLSTALAERPASAPATILYTSGTTGAPKGVVNSHAAYLAAGRHTVAMVGLTPADRCMVVLPLFHANPQMYAVMSALQVGSALVLRERFSAGRFFEDAAKFGATGFTFVGTVLAILAARHTKPQRDHILRFCLGGGAPLSVWHEVEERFGIKVHELYGMTEIGGWVTANTLTHTRHGSCGQTRPDMEVRVVDADDRILGPDAAGEIVVRPRESDVILSGYYRQPDKLAEACRNLWFHTGDLGRFDADGYLWFQGRSKELIRRAGEMIAPAEIETRLLKLPGVLDCAAVAVADPILGEEIKVAVVRAGDAALQAGAVRAYLATYLPAFMLPRYVEFLDTLPKTETEKLQRHKLTYLNDQVEDLLAPDAR
ncbi:MAG: AMP-binding protein [Actinomycetospora chiangmaiensis]|nr:AMP-binding protein [Actinomycetospora chiangmaiensis]